MTFYPNANKIRAEPFHGNEHEIALPSVVLHELRYGWLKMNAGKKKDAISHGLTLVTRNTKDFSDIAQLQLANWFE